MMILKIVLSVFFLLPNGGLGQTFCNPKNCDALIANEDHSLITCAKLCDDWTEQSFSGHEKCIEYLFIEASNECKICSCPDGGVNGDPLFLGLRGQVFTFDGRDGAWYANIATKQLQWNLQFGQFKDCPKDRDMFVTATSMLFYKNDLFKKETPIHSILIKSVPINERNPDCLAGENVCLGNGSLSIVLDGHEITSPGGHWFTEKYGRVIAHNTFAACSRKWYDYRAENKAGTEHDTTSNRDGNNSGRRNLRLSITEGPINYLIDNKERVLNPDVCKKWLDKRIINDDIFKQRGEWVTIHVETPMVSFHVEFRVNTNEKECLSHTIDAWITRTSPELENEAAAEASPWRGILGETAQAKFNSDGNEVQFDRFQLLSAKDDEAYEVDGAFGTEFKAAQQDTSSSTPSS